MKSTLTSLRRTGVIAALAAMTLAVAASPAPAAPGFSIQVTGPDSAVVGKPVLLKISGKNPSPAESWFNAYLDVDAIPASVLGSCPSHYLQGVQVAEQSESAGGHKVAPPQVEVRDDAGNWSSPVAFTPRAPGKVLICAYSQNVSNTLALDEHAIQVQPASAARKGKKCKKGRKGAAAAGKKCRRRK